jgi:hypothetical protein
VTVEAERDDKNGDGDIGYPTEADPEWKENKDSGSPIRGRATRRTRTTTTKVPLKGLESSPPAPKRRGRPKKSETPARPRNGTPVPKTRGRRKTAGDVPNEGDTEDPEALTPKRPRARSKKGHAVAEDNPGTVPDIERNDGAHEDTAVIASPFPVKSKTPTRKSRAKNLESPVKIAVDRGIPADMPKMDPAEQTRASVSRADKILGDVPADHAPSALTDLSVNSLAMAEIAQPGNPAPLSSGDVGEQMRVPRGKPSPTKRTLVKPKQPERAVSVDATPARFSSISHLADQQPFESSVIKLGEELPVADDPGYATASEPPPVDGYDLDYSVLESEGFSMVSISSIPSMGGYMCSPTPQESHHDGTERDLVQSLTEMNLQSLPTHGKSQQWHRNVTPEEIWQLERNAVSRQIEMTDPDQVITIDSDNEHSATDEDRGRIDEESFVDPGVEYQMCRGRFLQDQERLLQEDCQHSSNLEIQGSTNLDDLFSNEDAKPRRGKIPSPWRTERQVAHSDGVDSGDDSGLLPPLLQEEEAEEEVQRRETTPKGIESPADLSQLLGLKSSPVRDSNGNKPNVEKSLRQRLIEKFYWAKQSEPQIEEPSETKPMEASGRLILYPSLPDISNPEEDIVPKYDGLPVTGLWGVDSLETQVDRQRRRRRCEKRATQKTQEVSGGSTPVEDVNVGKMLGARTYGISPPDGFPSEDKSLGNSSVMEQRPLVFKLLSDKPANASSASTNGLEPTTSSSALFSTTNPNPEPTQTSPIPQKTWTKDHWNLLNTLWLASKKSLRLHREKNPANPPPKKTYTTGNLSFHCPGRRSLVLDDDEMDVVREFGLVMRRRLGGHVDADALFGEDGEFGERKVAKRLYSMIVGEEERRRRGEVYDEWGRWVGYGDSKKKG